MVGNVVMDAVVDGDVEEVCVVDKVANGLVSVCVVAKVVIWVFSVVSKVVNGVVSVVGKVVIEVASVVDKVVGGVVMVTVVEVGVVNAVTVVDGDVVLVVNVEVEEEDVVGTGGVVEGVWLITPLDSISTEDISNSMMVMLPAEMPPAVTATTLMVKNNLIDWFANLAVFVALSKQQHTSQSMKAPRQKPNAKASGF